MGQRKSVWLLRAALLTTAIAALPTEASAQSIIADRQIAVAIPAQALGDALRQLAETSGLQLVYDTRITDSKSSPSVNGTMSSRAALQSLLAGSGLTFQFSGDRTVIISGSAKAAGGDDGIRSVGVVSVEGVAGNMPYGEMMSPVNGTNGSRDVEATEGTGSYTTGAMSIVSKIPQTLRETPQAVSVVTKQRIDDQNLVSIKDILEVLPGTTSTPGPNSEEFSIYSRGFEVKTFSFDGGAPVTYDYGNRPVLNTSEFDSVQLVRGANGLFGGYGDPGGTVNLVRKKPLDHPQLIYTQDVGSWNNFREEIDGTMPLTKDGSLRARAVASRLDTEYFYDVAESTKTSVYGVLEYDLTPKTLVTFGASYTRERNRPNQGGLPRYTDGTEIDFPRSTCLCLPFVYDNADRTEIFASISQKITADIATKLNVTYNYQKVDAIYYGVSSAVDRGGSSSGTFGGFRSSNPAKDFAADFNVTGKFDLLNRQHEFVVGGNYRHVTSDGAFTTGLPNITVPDVFNFNPDDYTAPTIPAVPDFLAIRSRLEEYGIYGNLKLEVFNNLHFLIGMRHSGYSQDGIFQNSFSPDPQVSPPLKDKSTSSPNLAVTFDFFDNFTLFGSYMRIYRPQTFARQMQVNALPPPITGVNKEVGIKWESANKKINASISYYKITQNNFLVSDFENPGSNLALTNDTKSEGVDFEVAGEILPGWQISASYSYNDNSVTRDAFPSGTSTDVATSFTPKHRVKTFTTYRGQPGEFLDGFIIGGGIDYQSSAYNTGFVCTQPPADPNDLCPEFSPYQFTTKGYATLSLLLGYRLTKNVELAITGKNVTDVKAYVATPFQNLVGYNFYTEPANVTASLRFKF